MQQKLLELLISFDWDDGNSEKNYRKHGVTYKEAEEVFLNDDILILPDNTHSQNEERYCIFGKTNNERKLSIAFTIRKKQVRVIMARDMSRKERIWYDKEI
jgi:hypothetical protein